MREPMPRAEAAVRPGWTFGRIDRPDGGHVRVGRWNAAAGPGPRGTVMVLTGRCECLEKFAETAADLAARGFGVVGMDWRGQGGSSRFLSQRHRGHATDFAVLLDDLETATAELIPADSPRPWLILAHSMGGHLTLRHLLERRHPFDGAILSAPMFAIRAPLPEVVARRIAGAMVARGRGADYALGQTDWNPEPDPFEGNPFTADPVRFRVLHGIYTANPELALGGVTWGWLHAAYLSMAHVRTHPGLGSLKTPVLLLSAGADRVVDPASHRRIAARMPGATLQIYPEARHELLMETDAVRARLWADVDAWLAATFPAA